MDTDGYLQSGSHQHPEIAVSCEALADGIVHLDAVAAAPPADASRLRTDSHRITVRLPRSSRRSGFRRKICTKPARSTASFAPLKASSMSRRPGVLHPSERPDALYVTDDFIVTHNTVQALGTVAEYTARDVDGPKLIVARTA